MEEKSATKESEPDLDLTPEIKNTIARLLRSTKEKVEEPIVDVWEHNFFDEIK